MRTDDYDVTTEQERASADGLAAVPAPAAPNVRVAPAPSRAGEPGRGGGEPRPAAQPGPAGNAAAPVPGAWCADAVEADPAGAGRGTVGARDARRPGRPRSERAEQAILDAAIEAVGENGIDGMSCEDVAARAGVGKATLYRRWAGKEDLLIAAFAAMKHPLPQPRGESVRTDLVDLLTAVSADADDPRFAQHYALLHGAGQRYPRLVARYREEVVEPRRELIRTVLRRGIATGELRQDLDVEVAMLLLTGAVLTRGKHDPTPAAPGFVARAVDELLRGITPR